MVILDEVFDHAAMEASRLFFPHETLAAPEKLLQAVEDHIGGALVVG
ncbi:hypothetical protein [uncultured Corynebacterium sp.]|nr:hypothetical protein [uncultured Corynebacterium sp.]